MTDLEQTQAIVFLAALVAIMSAVIGAPLVLRSYARSLKRHMVPPGATARPLHRTPPPPTTARAHRIPPPSTTARAHRIPPPPTARPAHPSPPPPTAPPATAPPATEIPPPRWPSNLRIDVIRQRRLATFRAGGDARQARNLSLFMYLAGGLAFAVTAVVLVFIAGDVEFLPLRVVATTIAFSSPNIVVVGVIFGAGSPQFRFAIATYTVALVSLGVANGVLVEPTADLILAPLLIWIVFGGPALILLALLNSRVRAVAPVLMAVIGPAAAGATVAIGILSNDSIRLAAATVAADTGIGAEGIAAAIGLVGLVAMGWVGLGAARWLAKAVDEQRISQEGLIVDLVWVFQSLMVAVYLQEAAVLAVLPISVYKLVSAAGLRQVRRSLDRVPARPLLLLRVFRPDTGSRDLLDDLAHSWSYRGPIRLISAPDLANHAIDHGKVLLHLGGRLGELFLRTDDDLRRRLGRMRTARDGDARFRVEPFYCQGEIWRATVRALISWTDLVIMDLRGFNRENRGCAYEIECLLNMLPTERILLLVDSTTRADELNGTIASAWDRLMPDSPNGFGRPSRLSLLDVTDSDRSVADVVVALSTA